MEVFMRNFKFFLSLFIAFFIFSCAGPKTLTDVSEGDVPEWYSNMPQDQNYLYARGTATSLDLQLADTKATNFARQEMGRQINANLKSILKNFQEETGFGEDTQLIQQFSNASKTVVDNSISGCTPYKHKHIKDGKMWRVYSLVQYPIGAGNQLLMQQLKNNQELLTKIRSTETFKELENEVADYRELKNK